MSDEKLINGVINPLAFLEVDLPWASLNGAKPTLESVLRYLCPLGEDFAIEKLLDRYREISTEPVRLFFAPAERRVLDKLIWPLRNAKASYMVGNYLGTISVAGMVAEMVAMLIWEMAETHINGRRMSKAEEELLFGRDFEKLGQERRVSVLSAYGLIDGETKSNFEKIRQIRRQYLHLWSQDHDQLPTDGVQSFLASVSLVLTAIGQDVREGRFILSPGLARYLDRHQEPVDGTSVQHE